MKNFFEFGLGFCIWMILWILIIGRFADPILGIVGGVLGGLGICPGGSGGVGMPIGGPVPVTPGIGSLSNKLIKTQLIA